MSVEEFDQMTPLERVGVINKRGTLLYILESDEGQQRYYALDKFWVHMLIVGPQNDITSVRAFRDGWHLDRMLDLYEVLERTPTGRP